ncbi:MAG: response regulator [Planctomycetota bacterium]|jgi:response regulator RpfG family c-di-GMP phosphodiesterase|nr:response regulator [Planctomycetota bacterium]MDA1026598.1 response regulator [Planctomycetota bacterium]
MNGTTTKVLLVDDQAIVIEGMRRMLAPHPEFEFEAEQNPAVAVEVARRFKPDVILQDLVMPEVDGFDLLREYRRTAGLADVPVIVLSSREEGATKAEAFERGADDYLVKMPEVVELVARIRIHVERRRSLLEQRRARRRLEEANRDIARLNEQIESEKETIELGAQRDRARLAAITTLGADLNRYQDFELLLDRILLEARKCCDAEAGAIFTIAGEQLECNHIQNDKVEGRGDISFTHRMSRALSLESVAGTVALTGRAIRVEDAYSIPPELDCSYDTGRDLAAGYRTKALLSLPLRTRDGKIRGVLQLANPGGEDAGIAFTDEDQQIIEHFAGLATVAIERTAMTRALVMRMIAMAEVRDPTETGTHVQRVAGYSTVLYDAWAHRHGVSDVEREKNRDRLRTAAMLHDVGKVGIPDAILKKPGRLDDVEFAHMQRHAVIGARLFRGMRTDFDEVAREVALHHHERWDGTGYPGPIEPDAELEPSEVPTRIGLKGEEIPLFARIVGLADVYDALSSKRTYKDAWPESKVLGLLVEESGSHFDPELVEILLERIDEIRAVRHRYHG